MDERPRDPIQATFRNYGGLLQTGSRVCLLVLTKEKGNIVPTKSLYNTVSYPYIPLLTTRECIVYGVYRDYVEVIFPHSLLRASKFRVEP